MVVWKVDTCDVGKFRTGIYVRGGSCAVLRVVSGELRDGRFRMLFRGASNFLDIVTHLEWIDMSVELPIIGEKS